MPSQTDELRPDRILTHHWRCREEALLACGLPPMGRDAARSALASMVAAAGLAAETDQPWTSFSRRRQWYAAKAENGDLTYDNVIAAMKRGVEAGLFEEDRALQGAHLDDVPRQSRYRATPLLIERLGDARFEHVRPSTSILLRDADGRPVDFPVTEVVRRLRRKQDERNEWLAGLKVTVDPKADPADWRRTAHHLHARKVRDGRETWACALPDPSNRLVRIYGRSRFDHGGRAYGWWQQLPSDRRAELMINGEFTFEPDFPTLHPRFAYALVGAEMPEDVYTTEQGHDRKHGKLALNILFNCKRGLRGAVDTLLWKDGWTGSRAYTEGLVQAIADLNAPIAGFLGSDAGIRFMNIDAGMAMEVMDRCRREDIPCLPVHDSFRVPTKAANHITAIMGEVLDATLAKLSDGTISVAVKRSGRKKKRQIIPQDAHWRAASPAASTLPASPGAEPRPETPLAEPALVSGDCEAWPSSWLDTPGAGPLPAALEVVPAPASCIPAGLASIFKEAPGGASSAFPSAEPVSASLVARPAPSPSRRDAYSLSPRAPASRASRSRLALLRGRLAAEDPILLNEHLLPGYVPNPRLRPDGVSARRWAGVRWLMLGRPPSEPEGGFEPTDGPVEAPRVRPDVAPGCAPYPTRVLPWHGR